EGNVVDVRYQGRKAAAVYQLGAGQRHGPVSAAVERPEERQRARAAGVPAGQFQPRLQRFGTAIGEEDALGRHAGRDLRQALGQVDLRLVVEVGPRHVDQLARLVLDRPGDLRMAVARRRDGDAGGEIEEEVAVHVLNDGARAAG